MALNAVLFGVFAGADHVPGVSHAMHSVAKGTSSRVAPVLGQRAGAVAGEIAHAGVHAGTDGAIARTYGAARH